MREDRKALLVRIAEDRYPGWTQIAAIAVTEEFIEWFRNITGFNLGGLLYTDVESCVDYIQMAFDKERLLDVPVKKSDGLVKYWKRRKDRIRKATPAWYDADKHQELVELREDLNKSNAGKAPFHIDHVIPIAGDTVCGLHVHTNMRVISGYDNCCKGNRFPSEGVDQ